MRVLDSFIIILGISVLILMATECVVQQKLVNNEVQYDGRD
jgi:hypothetical protein